MEQYETILQHPFNRLQSKKAARAISQLEPKNHQRHKGFTNKRASIIFEEITN